MNKLLLVKSANQITFDFVSEAPVKKQEKEAPAAETLPKKRGRKPKDPSAVIKKLPSKRGRKSLKETDAEADLINIPEDEILFQKQYYSMGEVSEMFRINLSLLRFWEKEFDIINPKKNKKGDRFFRPVDIKNLQIIHHLIRQRKFTMEGAKDYLRKNSKVADKKFEMLQSLEKIRSFLLEIKANL
jgi:DNA-binding transcriptional MerR regulator